jgi:hypothetical protein
MPGIPVGDIVQVRFEYTHFAQKMFNVLNYKCSTGAGAGNIASETQAIADLIAGNGTPGSLVDPLVAILPATVTIDRVIVQDIAPTRWAYRFKTVGRTGARGDAPSANVDAVVTKRTDEAGRSKQGNFFLPGVASEDMIEGFITAGFQAAIITNLAFLKLNITTPSAGVYFPIIYNQLTTAFTPITSFYVHPEVRVLTRRTVGRGE